MNLRLQWGCARGIIPLALLLFASGAVAQSTCYQYAMPNGAASGYTRSWFFRPGEAAEHLESYCNGANSACGAPYQGVTCGGQVTCHTAVTNVEQYSPGTPGQWRAEFTVTYTFQGSTYPYGTVVHGISTQVSPTGCPPTEECNASHPDVGAEFVVTTNVPASACNPITHCRMKRGPGVCFGASCVWKVTHTSEACESSWTDPEQGNEAPGEQCISSGGQEFCMSEQGSENCGYYNDNFVCMSKVESDGCKVFGDGSRVCGAAAPTPPVPDSGVAGQPATPDAEVQVTNSSGNTTTNNYYDSTTVSNSVRDPGTSGDNPFDGKDDGAGDGGGNCEGDECDEGGSVSGGESCEVAPACEGDPLQCAVVAQSWRNRCVEGPTDEELEGEFGPTTNEEGELVSTVAEYTLPESLNSTGWIGGSECFTDVELDMGLMGVHSLPLSKWCELFSWVGLLVMVSAYLTGIKIIIGGL